MSAALRKRLRALEATVGADKPRQLSCLVDDDITDEELAALRKSSKHEIYRFKDDPLEGKLIG